MANEISITAALAYANPAYNILQQTLALSGLYTIAGKNYAEGSMVVPTTSGGTLIPLLNLSTIGAAILVNRDPTNYVQLLSAVSGNILARLLPAPAGQQGGPPVILYFDSGVTAPALIAHTATCLVQWLILEQ
jgi:hypothetical protein